MQNLKTLAELAAEAAITDTATTQITETQGKQWMERVIRVGQALRRFDQVVQMDLSLLGKGDKTLTIMKQTATLTVDNSAVGGEGDKRDNTEITNLDTVDITFANADFYRGKVSISKQIAMTSRVDLLAEAREAIANGMAQDLDNHITGTAILQNTNVTQRVYGGDATTVATLAAGDVITPDLLADAEEKIEDDNYVCTPEEGSAGVSGMFFIAPAQMKAFRKDSQFVNAAEYGDNSVVLRGQVGDYLGLRIVKTTNTPAYAASGTDSNETTNNTWAVAGHSCPLVGVSRQGRKVAGVVAWKELPHIDYKYEPDEAIHKVFLDQSFKGSYIQETAICLVKVTDA